MKILRFILTNLGPYKRVFYIVALASLINGAANFYIPVSLSEFANDPLRPGGLIQVIVVIVGLYVLSLGLAYAVRRYGEALAVKYANYIRLKYFRELAELPVDRLRKKHSGYVQSLVNRVAEGLGEIIYSLFWGLIPGVLLVMLFFIYIARESFVLAIINLLLMAVFVIASGVLARKMVPIAAEQNRRTASVMGSFADFVANITTVVQLGVQSYARGVLKRSVKHNDDKTDDLQRFHASRWFILHSLFGLAYLITIGFLVGQIAAGVASVGLLILFVSAYGMLRSLIEQLSENIKSFMQMKAYLEELEGFAGAHHEDAAHAKHMSWHQIRLRSVEFQHDGSSSVIRIPDFLLTKGQKVCIEGTSGQGKSTFLGLLTDTLQSSRGERTVDDKTYEQVGRGFFAAQAAIISQDTELFHVTIRENLTLGRDVSDETLMRYLDELELAEWFSGLNNGLDSLVGEKGVTLSAGQRQRVNILRGVLLDRSLYILDEPTSHLDDRTEKTVVQFLAKHLAGKTIVVVTHRPALESLCETTYVMKSHALTVKE